MNRLYNVAFLLSAAAALGCGADSGTMMMSGGDGPTSSPPDLLVAGGGDGPASPGDMATTPGSYPAGPYGNTVGATFPMLSWQGYEDDAADAVATTKPYGVYTSDDMFKSGRRYAMVHLADYI